MTPTFPVEAKPAPLSLTDLPRETVAMARWLIGAILVRDTGDETCIARIVETEAYPPGDPASHAFRGMTARNRAMHLRAGHAYVYLGYGVSWLVNVSSEGEGEGAAVLIRAAKPLLGQEAMAVRRGRSRSEDLMSGPGKLCQALGIDRSLDGVDLCESGPLYLSKGGAGDARIGESVRIGITRAVDQPWRFFDLERLNYVSGPKRLSAG